MKRKQRLSKKKGSTSKIVNQSNGNKSRKVYSKKYLSASLTDGNINNIFSSCSGVNPDRLIQQITGNSMLSIYDIMDDILSDGHVASVVELLSSGVLRYRPYIKSESTGEKVLYENMLLDKKLAMRDIIKQLVEGSLKGMAVFEIMWRRENGMEVIDKLIPLDNRDFKADCNGNLIWKGKIPINDPLYKYKFLVYRNKPYKNPYGVAEILKCYYPWQFKKAGWRFWMTTTEKYGVPTLVVEYDEAESDNTDSVETALAEAFFNIASDSVVVANNLKDLHIVESKAKAVEFKTLIDVCEQEISKVIVGTPILASSGKEGNRALAEIHANINYKYKLQNLILDISNVINTLIDYSLEINTGSKENKNNTEYVIEYVDVQEWEKMVQAIDRSIPISKKVMYKHIPEPENEEDSFVADLPMNTQNNVDMRDTDEKIITKETQTETDNDTDGKQKNNTT